MVRFEDSCEKIVRAAVVTDCLNQLGKSMSSLGAVIDRLEDALSVVMTPILNTEGVGVDLKSEITRPVVCCVAQSLKDRIFEIEATEERISKILDRLEI